MCWPRGLQDGATGGGQGGEPAGDPHTPATGCAEKESKVQDRLVGAGVSGPRKGRAGLVARRWGSELPVVGGVGLLCHPPHPGLETPAPPPPALWG